ncbi:MAG: multiheme c-type cytochrome [Planctomycetota bacterium]
MFSAWSLWFACAWPLGEFVEPPCHGQFADPAACGRCHRAVETEWKESAHARAFIDPVFVRAMQTRSEPERCVPCHAPASVLDRLGQIPRARNEGREHGVDCQSCHVRGDVVHGPSGIETEAHATTKDPSMKGRGSVALCSSCHDLRIADVLPLAREFLAQMDAETGDESCIGCHMEPTQRVPAVDGDASPSPGELRSGRSHRLLGPDDAAFCATAFDFQLERTGQGHRLVLRSGAGHGVPGLARLRSFAVRIRMLDRNGTALHEAATTFSWRNRLLVDEERRWDLPLRASAVALRVEVDHIFDNRKPTPVLDRTWELE